MLPYTSPKMVLNDDIGNLYPYIKQQVQIIQFRIISSVQNIHLFTWSLASINKKVTPQRSTPGPTEIDENFITDVSKTRVSPWPPVTGSK